MKTIQNRILFGGDYNPDQWSEEVFEKDIIQMKILGVNTVTLPVFSWTKIQRSEEDFDYDWLDKIVIRLKEEGISIKMATTTAEQPAWMSRR